MKTSHRLSFLPTTLILAVMMPIGLTSAIAQEVDTSSADAAVDTSTNAGSADTSTNEAEVDTSTGEVNNSSASPSVVPPQPVPVVLHARLAPADPASKAKGDLRFSLVGDMMNVTGRMEGLQPNTRYQLAIPPAAAEVDQAPEIAESGTEAPQAGQPAAGAPGSGTPDAGKPDGTVHPGAPGAGEGTSVTSMPSASPQVGGAKPGIAPEAGKVSGLLGIVTADSAGTASINLTIRSITLTTGDKGIQGSTVTLAAAPAEGDAGVVVVASGPLEISANGKN